MTMSDFTQQVLTDTITELQKRPHRATVEHLADYLAERAKAYGEKESVFEFSNGYHAGMKKAFELASTWIKDDLL